MNNQDKLLWHKTQAKLNLAMHNFEAYHYHRYWIVVYKIKLIQGK
jgi:hypothetical protein